MLFEIMLKLVLCGFHWTAEAKYIYIVSASLSLSEGETFYQQDLF